MTTVGHRLLNIPEADLLADLYGIDHDLASVEEFCRLLSEAWAERPLNLQLLDALSTAAVVRYARCFEGGVRKRLDQGSVAAVDPAFARIHDYFFYLRQKHLSHSVNEFEENCVTVAVVEPPDPRQVQRVGMMGGRQAGLDAATTAHLRTLAGKLRSALKLEIDNEQRRLQAIVDAMAVDDVYRLPEPDAFDPKWERVTKKRQRR